MSRIPAIARWSISIAAALGVLHFASRGLFASAIADAPNRALSVPPAADPPPAELDRFRAREVHVDVGPPAARLSAWVLEPGASPRGTIVVLHGIRLDKRSMLPMGVALAEAGFRVVLPDLRGHGHSSGKHLSYGVTEAHDLSALLDQIPLAGPVGACGYSLGGATAIQLAARDPRIRSVAALASFASLRGVTRDYLRRYAPALEPAVPDFWLDDAIDTGARRAAFDADDAAPSEAAGRLNAPLLVLHGSDDAQVPAHHAEAIARAAPSARVRLLPGQTHASVLADPDRKIRGIVVDWFEGMARSAQGSYHPPP